MKRIGKILLTIPAFFCLPTLALQTTSCGSRGVKPTSISDIVGDDEVEVGETSKYFVTVLPDDIKQEIEWTVDNEDAATIDFETGALTGVAVGEVTITAKVKKYESLVSTKKITIVPSSDRKIEIIGPDTVHLYSKPVTYSAKIEPEDPTDTFTWSVGDKEVATIDSTTGKLSTNTMGYVKIIATSTNHPDCSTDMFVNVDAPVAESWSSDDWRIISYFANQGLEALAKAYPTEYHRSNSDSHKIGDSFVGSSKRIYIPDFSSNWGNGVYAYDAFVIGENHDDLADGSGKAALTFQLDEVLSTYIGGGRYTSDQVTWSKYPLQFDWYDNCWYAPGDVWQSNYRIELENKVLPAMVELAKQPIFKQVKKTTPVGLKTLDTITTNEYLFPLDLSEIFNHDAILAATDDLSKGANVYVQCGDQYEYYKQFFDESVVVELDGANPYPELDRYQYDYRETWGYWLRTPFVDNENQKFVLQIDESRIKKCPVLDDGTGSPTPSSVIFCFCI